LALVYLASSSRSEKQTITLRFSIKLDSVIR
jgi:hypothetical protein